MTEHCYYTDGDFPGEGYYNRSYVATAVIDGGLAICKVCGGMEGGLPTECPGTWMDPLTSDLVYQGVVDFRFGQWVTGLCTVHMGGPKDVGPREEYGCYGPR